jgi:hypothetical protein
MLQEIASVHGVSNRSVVELGPPEKYRLVGDVARRGIGSAVTATVPFPPVEVTRIEALAGGPTGISHRLAST